MELGLQNRSPGSPETTVPHVCGPKHSPPDALQAGQRARNCRSRGGHAGQRPSSESLASEPQFRLEARNTSFPFLCLVATGSAPLQASRGAGEASPPPSPDQLSNFCDGILMENERGEETEDTCPWLRLGGQACAISPVRVWHWVRPRHGRIKTKCLWLDGSQETGV